MATEIESSHGQQCDSNGVPMSGALIYVYDVGTTTPKDVWSDTALSVTATNPVVCDAAGRHDMRYVAAGSYKYVVKTAAGATIYTRDNVDGRVPVGSGALAVANGGTGATTEAGALASLGAATAAEVAEIATDVASLAGALASTEATHLATGTTAQRAASPIAGDVRHNTTTNKFEGYIAAFWNFLTSNDYADKAIMEAASSSTAVVMPSVMHNHPGVAKAWAFITLTGSTPSITSSYNVASISDVGVGDVNITFTTPFSSANYAAIPALDIAESNASGDGRMIYIRARTASVVRVCTSALDSNADKIAEDVSFHVVCYGDQ